MTAAFILAGRKRGWDTLKGVAKWGGAHFELDGTFPNAIVVWDDGLRSYKTGREVVPFTALSWPG